MKIIAPLLLSALFVVPAFADEFTFKQKAEIEEIIRAYLLENPEILPEAIDALNKKQTRAAIAAAGDTLYDDAGAVRLGPENANVTIVEFYDYQCGFCRRALSDIERILKTEKDVNVLFRQLPIRDQAGESFSYDAARAALAAKRQKGNFLKFHKGLYDSPTRLTEARILEIAERAGYDIRTMKRDMDDPALADALERNKGLAAMLGLRGTPGYIIGDEIIPGAEGYEALIAAVRQTRRDQKSR